MRLYVHYTPAAAFAGGGSAEGKEHTLVVRVEQQTAQQLLALFATDYTKVHGTNQVPFNTHAVLTNSSGREFVGTKRVQDIFEDRDDVFIVMKKTAINSTAPSTTAIAATTTTATAVASKLSPTASTSTTSTSSASSTVTSSTAASSSASSAASSFSNLNLNVPSNLLAQFANSEQTIVTSIKNAQQFQMKGQLRKARDIYLALLDSVNLLPSSDKQEMVLQICHQQLAMIYLTNRFYSKSVPHFEKAVQLSEAAYELMTAAAQKNALQELAILIRLYGEAQFGSGNYHGAIKTFGRALKYILPSSTSPFVEMKQDIQVWLARSLYKTGDEADNRNTAISIFEGVIKDNEHHIAALTYYSQIAIDLGRGLQTIPYLLRALVTMQTKKKEEIDMLDRSLKETVQALFADMLMSKGGLQYLYNELHAAVESAPALTFLAQTVKDQGGIEVAIDLYTRAMKCKQIEIKQMANMVLNLVHTLEVAYKYQQAFEWIQKYCREHSNDTIGKYKIGTFYEAIKNIKDVYDVKLRTGEASGVPSWTDLPVIFDAGFCQVTFPGQDRTDDEAKAKLPSYSNEELNLLALLFTGVKILFVCGGLQVIPTLCHQLEPLRQGVQPLHLTTIRNEHAYYSTIAQVMGSIAFPFPKDVAEAKDPIYVCGDSHCLSSAWQIIEYCGKPTLLHPKLVTGLKCWHLRSSCRFYPKRNFEACVATIPNNANVIFTFGEIDCREGIIVSVEKAKYENNQQGIDVSIDAYLSTLKSLISSRHFNVWLHPIIPVLDVTRPMVKQFTATLKQQSEQRKVGIYLDFFQQLLCNGGTAFNAIYNLDGTHMSPKYVKLVEESLQQLNK